MLKQRESPDATFAMFLPRVLQKVTAVKMTHLTPRDAEDPTKQALTTKRITGVRFQDRILQVMKKEKGCL